MEGGNRRRGRGAAEARGQRRAPSPLLSRSSEGLVFPHSPQAPQSLPIPLQTAPHTAGQGGKGHFLLFCPRLPPPSSSSSRVQSPPLPPPPPPSSSSFSGKPPCVFFLLSLAPVIPSACVVVTFKFLSGDSRTPMLNCFGTRGLWRSMHCDWEVMSRCSPCARCSSRLPGPVNDDHRGPPVPPVPSAAIAPVRLSPPLTCNPREAPSLLLHFPPSPSPVSNTDVTAPF